MKPFNIEAYNAMSPDEMVRDLSGHMVWIMCLDGKLSPYYAPDRPVVAVVHYGDGWSNTFTYPSNGQLGANPSDADLVIVKRDAPGLNWIDATPARQNLFVHTPPPPRRPMSSLTEEEAKALFAKAFYYWDGYEELQVRLSKLSVEIKSEDLKLLVTQEGVIVASKESQNACTHARFNAVAVVRYLDSIGIEIG